MRITLLTILTSHLERDLLLIDSAHKVGTTIDLILEVKTPEEAVIIATLAVIIRLISKWSSILKIQPSQNVLMKPYLKALWQVQGVKL